MSNRWDRLVENKIREAQEHGDLKPPTGRGRLSEDPDEAHIPEDERLVARILKNAGALPGWIDEDKGLRRLIEEALARAARGHAWRLRRLAQAEDFSEREKIETRWRAIVARLEADIAEINRQIFAYNLRAPTALVQRRPLRAAEELARITREKA